MIAYSVNYRIRNKVTIKQMSVDAKNLASAKKKIGKKNGYKDGRMITILAVTIIGYY